MRLANSFRPWKKGRIFRNKAFSPSCISGPQFWGRVLEMHQTSSKGGMVPLERRYIIQICFTFVRYVNVDPHFFSIFCGWKHLGITLEEVFFPPTNSSLNFGNFVFLGLPSCSFWVSLSVFQKRVTVSSKKGSFPTLAHW